jgi:hypothetical protein
VHVPSLQQRLPPELHVDAKLDPTVPRIATSDAQSLHAHSERLILGYWLTATVLGVVFLRDMISVWNVPATLGNPALIVYLILTFALSQVLYAFVARFDKRPFRLGATTIFALGNGIAETFAFALVYRLGELLGSGLFGLFAPGLAAGAGFAVGVIFFAIYGGLIHGLFWLRVLPPHLNDSPRAVRIRKMRPLAEIALVLGWSLCFWLTRDIWTVVFFHVLVDIGLMLKVRPTLFQFRRAGA